VSGASIRRTLIVTALLLLGKEEEMEAEGKVEPEALLIGMPE